MFTKLTVELKNNVWHLQVFQRRFAPIWGCPLCFGIGVRFGLEWVSVNYWNQCPDSSEYTPSPVGELYVKFTADADTEFLLLSFKEKDDD